MLTDDYVELGHPLLNRMWEKRVRGYLAMGYKIGDSQENVASPAFFHPPELVDPNDF